MLSTLIHRIGAESADALSSDIGQVVDSDLLLSTGFDSEHVVLFLCHIFIQRQMNDRMIERSDGRGFGQQQLLTNSSQSIETLLTLELSQYGKSGSMFSSSEPVAARSDCCRLGNALCLCSPLAVPLAQAEQESCPTSWAADYAI